MNMNGRVGVCGAIAGYNDQKPVLGNCIFIFCGKIFLKYDQMSFNADTA